MSTFSQYEPRLKAAAAALGIEATEQQRHTLLSYLDQLQRWNRTYNLTALRDPEQMLIQHVFDSMSVVPALSPFLSASDRSTLVVDVGSGGGLPGVILATFFPGAAVHCVDTVEKKATFVRYVAGVLRLDNLSAHHARIEGLPPFGADIVTSRAFASLVDFATLSGQHVKQGGKLVAMKARDPKDEIAELHANTPWRMEQIDELNVPELDAERCLVWLTEQGTN